MTRSDYIPMGLSPGEVKLILRLRQLRKLTETCIFMVTTTPLTLSVMGKIELLENVCMSGSGAFG
ncbi:MAG: hypothetical protein WC341_00360 [Bacteroidales bacterium]|jgi:hypothetical protein